MSSVEELRAELAASQKDLQFYQNKIKDVVQAYKNLDNEKKALEKVVAAFKTDAEGQEGAGPATTADTLKVALADLTREKKKREQAYISDKKALVEEVEKQKARAEKMAEQLESANEQLGKAAKIVDKVKDQKKIIKQIEAERDKELQDHGCILAEMQKRFGEEKTKADKLSKQVAELYTKLQTNDDLPNQLRQKENEWKAQVDKLQSEIEEWKKRAAVTPTLQLLQNQMDNLRIEHSHAMEEALSKASHGNGNSAEDEKRRYELENRLVALSEQTVNAEKRFHEVEEQYKEAQAKVEELEKKLQTSDARPHVEDFRPESLEKNLRHLVALIKKEHKDMDVFEIVGASQEVQTLKSRYDRLENDFEKHKLKAEALLRAKNASRENEADKEESAMRALVGQLHEKLRGIEASAATDRAQYEQATRAMKDRIGELESGEEKLRREMQSEMANKVAEMEHEMQKQRNRTFDLLEEKDRELEITRGILLAVRSESSNHSIHASSSAPADPPQKSHLVKKRSNGELRQVERRKSSGFRHRSTDSISSAIEYYSAENATTQLPLANESRNIYYEEEMTKKDLEIRELRSQLNNLDFRMREIEQNHLTKDLQQHEMGEKLKEEIRILEGKLQLISSGGELEYMRNIFVQFLQSNNSASRKNIIKAIGMCLKLSATEMKAIDKKAF
ncbi:unnamed protein product, partial [Mesorhabditis belari]|uniref:GRIP domain-containing protein n=1 Tax=Mesorhabditis belari TaxID=2138241 RepID=A0AAF3FLK4_9BILA